MLYCNCVGIGIQIGHGLVFGDPAAVNLVRNHLLSSLVEEIDDYVLSKVGEGDLGPEACSYAPDFAGPFFEIRVVSYASFKSNGIVLVAPGGFVRGARVTSFSVFNYLRGSFQRAALADPCHIAAIPLDSELEVLVGIEACCVDLELGQWRIPPPYV